MVSSKDPSRRLVELVSEGSMPDERAAMMLQSKWRIRLALVALKAMTARRAAAAAGGGVAASDTALAAQQLQHRRQQQVAAQALLEREQQREQQQQQQQQATPQQSVAVDGGGRRQRRQLKLVVDAESGGGADALPTCGTPAALGLAVEPTFEQALAVAEAASLVATEPSDASSEPASAAKLETPPPTAEEVCVQVAQTQDVTQTL